MNQPTVFLRNAYNYDRDEASVSSGLACEDESLTDQSFKEECDINTIVEQFGITGQLPTDVRVPLEGDFTTVVDYQTALNMVREADAAFMEMPANVRERFGNDPGKFVEFASDPANLEECRKLGLADPVPRAAEPVRVIVETGDGNVSSEPSKTS